MKTTSDLYAPISGEILEVNDELDSQPELLNEDPYEKGWILKLKIKNMDELANLMSMEEYEAFVEKEADGA
jgi:glycine cleavage system H protein